MSLNFQLADAVFDFQLLNYVMYGKPFLVYWTILLVTHLLNQRFKRQTDFLFARWLDERR